MLSKNTTTCYYMLTNTSFGNRRLSLMKHVDVLSVFDSSFKIFTVGRCGSQLTVNSGRNLALFFFFFFVESFFSALGADDRQSGETLVANV